MASEPRPLISEDLLHQVEATARAQNREPAEVLEEAWARYVDEQSWARLVKEGQQNSRRLGLQESDTERLIAEYRQEKRGR
jgi:predicted transcriptional regulator